MKTKTWEVKIILKLNEDSHPRKWIPDAVWESLHPEDGEDVLEYQYKELT